MDFPSAEEARVASGAMRVVPVEDRDVVIAIKKKILAAIEEGSTCVEYFDEDYFGTYGGAVYSNCESVIDYFENKVYTVRVLDGRNVGLEIRW